MKIKEPLVKIIVLDTDVSITRTIEEVLKELPCEIKKANKLSEINEPCDYFIFYEDSINDESIEYIIKLPDYIKQKIFVCNKDYQILGRLVLELSNIILVEELNFMLKSIISEYIEKKFGPAYSETMQVITKFVNEAVHDIKLFLIYFEYLKNDIKKDSDDHTELIKKFETSLKDLEKGLIYFQNFVFMRSVPLSYEDINILVQSVLRKREDDLKNKTEQLIYLPDYTLPMLKSNSVVLAKVINNLIDVLLLSTKEIQSIQVSTKNQKNFLVISFNVECSDFDKTLLNQIYNPLFPKNVLDNSFIDYFRTNIEEFLKVYTEYIFNRNKLSFVIKMEMESQE